MVAIFAEHNYPLMLDVIFVIIATFSRRNNNRFFMIIMMS
jgi:hypothetical protein